MPIQSTIFVLLNRLLNHFYLKTIAKFFDNQERLESENLTSAGSKTISMPFINTLLINGFGENTVRIEFIYLKRNLNF